MIKTIQVETKGAVSSMEEGTKQVADGIVLADKAGDALREIVGMIQSLADMIGQIAAASEQQSSASSEIAKNVERISEVTNHTADSTRQMAEATGDLNHQTENLHQLVARFVLIDEHAKSAQKELNVKRVASRMQEDRDYALESPSSRRER
jgi:methyl-accepting chemotaxis protein